MTMKNAMGWAAACVLLSSSACNSGDEVRLPAATTALAVEDGIVFLDDVEPTAYVLGVDGKEPEAKPIALPEGDHYAFARPGRDVDEALVLTTGVDARREHGDLIPEVRGHLVHIGASGELQRYELPSRFAELALSEDGRYALAHSPAQGFSFGTGVALVDLDAPFAKGQNPRALNITPGDGRVADRFVFSPEVQAAGEMRRFLVSLYTGGLNILDLTHLDRGEISIPLTLPGDGRTLVPSAVAFDGDQLYVQSEGASDLLVVQLTATSLDLNPHGFETSLLSLPTGHDVRGLLLVGEGDEKRVIALGSGVISVIDPRTSTASPLSVQGRYDHGLLFEGRAPDDDQVRPRALLYGASEDRVAFVDVAGLGQGTGSAIEELTTAGVVRRLDALAQRGYVVLSHDTDQVSVVSLERRTASPLSLGATVQRTYLDVEHERLWLTTAEGRLGTVDLASLLPEEVVLDARALSLVPLRGRAPRMAVLHPSEGGFVTLLDADAPSRSTARALIGFFWHGLLD